MIYDPAEEMRRYLREHPTLEALRLHVCAHPEDEATRLVYADALKEACDPVADYLANPPPFDDDEPSRWLDPEHQVLIPWDPGWTGFTEDDPPW